MNKIRHHTIVQKPWGHEVWFAWTNEYLGKMLVIKPNQQVSMHYHEVKRETMYLQEGTMELRTMNQNGVESVARTLKAGESLHLEPREIHSMRNVGGEAPVILFEVSTPFPEDSVRVKDYYGRGTENKANKQNFTTIPCNTWEHPDAMADRIKT